MENIIEKILWEQLGEEGITKDIVEQVMLDIAYSPVIPIRGGSPIEIRKSPNGQYYMPSEQCPSLYKKVNENEVRIMRCRYLLSRSNRTNHLPKWLTDTLGKITNNQEVENA